METTHSEIVEYWSNHQDECGLSVDWSEANQLCWRCTGKRQLQRCHIIPRSLGGSEEVNNLVLLCGQCHSEAPNVSDPKFMWVWLRAHAVTFTGTYWYQRGFREYELVFGKKPFSDFDSTEIQLLKFRDALEKYMQVTGIHWGQGKINPATVAWLIHQAELDILIN